jgi:DICT domain-containing protein
MGVLHEVDIDPSFSVYGLVGRVMKENILLQSRKGMSLISREIENTTLIDNAQTRVFSSFQRLSRFLPQIDRYRQLAERAEEVYVFGEPDIATLPDIKNLRYVPIKPDSHLAREWFLISYGKDFYSALVTEELTHIDDPDDQRQFRGLWTFDHAIISTLHEWLAGLVGLSPHISQLNEEPNYPRQVQLMSHTISRIVRDLSPANRTDGSA